MRQKDTECKVTVLINILPINLLDEIGTLSSHNKGSQVQGDCIIEQTA